jgi:DNA-binding XRE family transcriptional regulator
MTWVDVGGRRRFVGKMRREAKMQFGAGRGERRMSQEEGAQVVTLRRRTLRW